MATRQKANTYIALCVVYKNVAIPIYWNQLDKNGGHSSQEDRQNLILQASEIFNLSGKVLLADREFVGDEWLKFLKDAQIDFIIRLSKTCYKKRITQSIGVSHSSLEKKALKRKTAIGKVFRLNGNEYTFVAIKNAKKDIAEPVLFLISSLTNYKEITNTYRIRWRIETCFRQLKTKGFNIEVRWYPKAGHIFA
ncbi:transposase [Pseudarcicella hirudinis]|uniref:transposase n=1 Tax=Pseudarcicella hirudinis TaxID=1079859 RepID=UPI001C43468A|nr:transposase [Pseudarcicella hirudinis]